MGSAVVIAFFITKFILSATIVDGVSMENTLQDGDRLFVLKMGVSVDTLDHGDIIVFHAPDQSGRDYIKRVIGLPGDFIQIEDGYVYVNNQRLEEPYISTAYTHISERNPISEWYVGKGEIFVLGDNRKPGRSEDSRAFGTISSDAVVGKAIVRFFPWSRMGTLHE